MADRSIRLLLSLGSALCIVGAISAVVIGRSLPIQAPVGQIPAVPSVSASIETNDDESVLGAEQFKYVWGKQLQNPVVDPPTVVEQQVPSRPQPVQPAPKPEPVRFEGELIGTLVDSDPVMARAWLKVKNQKRMVATGQTLDDLPGKPTVTLIADQQIDVVIDGQSISLAIAKPVLGNSAEATHGN